MNSLKPTVSIIVPVMNEAENIEGLADEITRSMAKTEWTWECVWIDDWSIDETRRELRKIHADDHRHRYFLHAKNFGQSAALITGFKHSHGEIIVTIDGDGQNDPADIPNLIRILLDEGADMVNGWREKRRDSLTRKICSKIANGFRNHLTGESVRDVGCSSRAFKRECVDTIIPFKGMHRFFPTLVKLAGHEKILETSVNHRPRMAGKTKYGVNNRLWVGIIDVLAVRWMRGRLVFPTVAANAPSSESEGADD